jgi:anti-sigma regulatory factor (Ser/Thr protein kinase)
MTVETETRTFAAGRGDIGAIDEWIEGVGRRWDASARTRFRARICVAELAANVIEHGVARSDNDHIIVTLSRSGDGIAIEFMDAREPFDPTLTPVAAQGALEPASIESAAIGGRGLGLVRAYAKDVSYRRDGRYNRVTLKIKSA